MIHDKKWTNSALVELKKRFISFVLVSEIQRYVLFMVSGVSLVAAEKNRIENSE